MFSFFLLVAVFKVIILTMKYRNSIVILFFFLDEKETKNQDLGFSAIKIGSLPKTQKLPRSQTPGLKQFEFLYGSFTVLMLACQILWSKKSSVVLFWN
ncbi:MAG: hypothetical protein RL699_381 [Bacteroidota bacterium]